MNEPFVNELSIFFPVHNEVHNLPKLLEDTIAILPEICRDPEIIIVDDGSDDGSGVIADQYSKKHSFIRVIHHEGNKGYGAALKTGFKSATKALIFYTDGDGQFNIRELKLILPLLSQADVVSAYRVKRKDPWHRLMNTKIFEFSVFLFFGLKIKDPDCAFKVYRKEVIDRIDMRSNGAMIDVEMLFQAQQQGYRIVQRGVEHYPRVSGESSGANLRVIFRAVREMSALWFRRFGRKPKKTSSADL